jgi:hypothetical protein
MYSNECSPVCILCNLYSMVITMGNWRNEIWQLQQSIALNVTGQDYTSISTIIFYQTKILLSVTRLLSRKLWGQNPTCSTFNLPLCPWLTHDVLLVCYAAFLQLFVYTFVTLHNKLHCDTPNVGGWIASVPINVISYCSIWCSIYHYCVT